MSEFRLSGFTHHLSLDIVWRQTYRTGLCTNRSRLSGFYTALYEYIWRRTVLTPWGRAIPHTFPRSGSSSSYTIKWGSVSEKIS